MAGKQCICVCKYLDSAASHRVGEELATRGLPLGFGTNYKE